MNASPPRALSSIPEQDESTDFDSMAVGRILDELSSLPNSDNMDELSRECYGSHQRCLLQQNVASNDEFLDESTAEYLIEGDPRDWKYRRPYIEFLGIPDARCKFLSNTHGAKHWPEFSYVFDGRDFFIGRDKGTWIINDKDMHVSSTHLKIYTIDYDTTSGIPPMVYCEDQLSLNGTYVNGQRIGSEKITAAYGRIPFLLNDGDTILIKPSWEFRFHQPHSTAEKSSPIKERDTLRIEKEYRVSSRVLGTGEFGAVHLAVERSTSRQVACKIIDMNRSMTKYPDEDERTNSGYGKAPYWNYGARQRQKVKAEVTILASLNNVYGIPPRHLGNTTDAMLKAHILNLRKAFYSDDMIYIFTDLATGGDLYSFVLARNCLLPDGQARIIAWQLLQAIKYIHGMEIVHRDIKPENVLLSNADWGSRVILTDFGFAKHLGGPNGRAKSEVGTGQYMAPEVFSRPMNGYSKAADLWSFGILIPFMLTGQHEIAPKPQTRYFHEHLQEFINLLAARQDVRYSALLFVKSLLVMDERKRLTAEQALAHQWFKEHHGTAEAMKRGWERLVRAWEPRDPMESLIEDLQAPIRRVVLQGAQQSKTRKILTDASIPQLPSLARHLQPKQKSHRRELLNTLNGSPFITGVLLPVQASDRKRKRQDQSQIEIVDGRDMFTRSSGDKTSRNTSRKASQPIVSKSDEIAIVTDGIDGLRPSNDICESLVAVVDCGVDSISMIDQDYGTDVSIQDQTVSQYFRKRSLNGQASESLGAVADTTGSTR